MRRIGASTRPETNPSPSSAVTPNTGLWRAAMATRGMTLSSTIARIQPSQPVKSLAKVSDCAPRYPPQNAPATLRPSSMYVFLMVSARVELN